MKKILLLLLYFFFTTKEALAAPEPQRVGLDMDRQGRGIKVNLGDPASTIGNIMQNVIVLFFTLGGLGFIIMFLWGAVNWILSGGDKEKVSSARKRITTAIIGLVVLSLTFVIMQVLGQILGIDALQKREFIIPRLTQ